MSKKLQHFLFKELQNLEAAGLYQKGIVLTSPQQSSIETSSKPYINFASDNYLGWSNDARFKEHAAEAIEKWGVGWASSRVVTGTHDLHRDTETSIAEFLHTEECAIFSSSYQAQLGLFENVFNEQDYLFCDFALHPGVVDGVRLCQAQQFIFRSLEIEDIEDKLKRSPNARFRAIVVEAVNPTDGSIAPLAAISELAQKYEALLILHDPHGVGVIGTRGAGAAELSELKGKVDVIVGSFGHALGGGDGGFLAGRRDVISWIRQKSRTYLFSNSLSPAATATAQLAIRLLNNKAPELAKLAESTQYFREQLLSAGFELADSMHPIVSVIVKDAVVAQRMINRLGQKGIYLLGFCYPVVPRGSARLRVQISAAHLQKDLQTAVAAFKEELR